MPYALYFYANIASLFKAFLLSMSGFINLRDWLEHRKAGSKKTNSILLSFIGDVVVPHGGSISLGSLVHVGELLGITEQTVRSAANRLAADGWIVGETMGRRSFYTLTPLAKIRFASALRRIFYHAETTWSGEWSILMIDPAGFDSVTMDEVNRDLAWTGFGRAANGVFVRPLIDKEFADNDLLINEDACQQSICFTASQVPCSPNESLQPFIKRLWDMDAVEARYKAFVETYDPVLAAVWGASSALDGDLALALRTFLKHDYRRIRLVDPQLPPELQPENWVGNRALYIAHEIYDFLLAPSEEHIMTSLQGPEGQFPQLHPDFYERFGGLSR